MKPTSPPPFAASSPSVHELVQHLLDVPQPPQQLRVVLRQRAEPVRGPPPGLAHEHRRRRLRAQQNLAPVLEPHLNRAIAQAKQDRVPRAKPILDVRKVRRGGTARRERVASRRRRLSRRARVDTTVPGRSVMTTSGTIAGGLDETRVVTETARAPLDGAAPRAVEVPAEVTHELRLLLQSLGRGRRRRERQGRGRRRRRRGS